MALLNKTEAKSALANVLKTAVEDVPDYWDTIIADGIAFADGEIFSRLIARGYTSAQVNAWDHRKSYAKKLFLWSALVEGGGLAGFDDKFIERLDVRESLDTLTLAIGGEYVIPAQGGEGAGTASFGDRDTSTDLFVLDPDDARRGEVTRW